MLAYRSIDIWRISTMYRYLSLIIIAIFLLISCVWPVMAAVDNRLGVTLNLGATASDCYPQISAAATAGVGSIRMPLEWERVQPKPGVFDWTYYDDLVAAAQAQHLDIVFVFGPMAQWASSAPATDSADVRACKMPKEWTHWQQYVTAAVCRYKGAVKHWQVWEAFDFKHFRSVSSQIEVLTCKTYQAVKAVDPTAKVIFPEVGGIDPGWIASLQSKPIWKYFDILGLRPYRQQPEATIVPLTVLQTEVMKASKLPANAQTNTSKSVAKPVWILGEAQGLAVDESEIDNVAQQRLLQIALAAGVQRIFTPKPVVLATTDPNMSQPEMDLSCRQAASTYLQTPNLASAVSGKVVFDMDATPVEMGLYNIPYRQWPGGRVLESTEFEKKVLVTTSILGSVVTEEDRKKDNPWFYFDIDDRFLYYTKGTTPLVITITCRGTAKPAMCGFNIYYDAGARRKFSQWQWIDAGKDQWFTYRIVLTDAWFANKDGYDFRINTKGSKDPVYITRVEVEPVTVSKATPSTKPVSLQTAP